MFAAKFVPHRGRLVALGDEVDTGRPPGGEPGRVVGGDPHPDGQLVVVPVGRDVGEDAGDIADPSRVVEAGGVAREVGVEEQAERVGAAGGRHPPFGVAEQKRH
ncbi:MAG: hypothetical protein H0W25_17950 [Acidimicrobiia bacterium]|nr:hypothetical protein [Acidimicrobiia bacterium]